MPRFRDTNAEVQRLREDIDSLRNTLELAGIIEPAPDPQPSVEGSVAADPDPDGGATDAAGEPVTGAGGDDVGSDSPPPDQTAEPFPGFHAAALRETRKTKPAKPRAKKK